MTVHKIDDEKAFNILKKYKIPYAKYVVVKNEKKLSDVKKIKFPLVAKAIGSKIIHKTEIKGVIKNINSEQEVTSAFKNLKRIKKCEKVMFQEQKEGIELIIGSKHDDVFGYIVSVGMGGIYTEIFKDVSFRICPISTKDAEKMLTELKGYDILKGYRNKKGINIEKVREIIFKVSKLSVKEKISEMDINPLICNEDNCWAVDVRILK